jgi:hypothetical protein
MVWAGHVARMETANLHTGFWLLGRNVTYNLEDLELDVTLILKLVFKKCDGGGGGGRGLD